MTSEDRMFLLAAIASNAPLGESRDLAVELVKGEISRLAKPVPKKDEYNTYVRLGVRARKVMERLGIKEVAELASKTDTELIMVRQCGPATLRELRSACLLSA